MKPQSHRANVRGADGITHDVRVWRTSTAACRAVVFDSPGNIDLAQLGLRLIHEGKVVEGPVDCMACLAALRTPYAVLCNDHGQRFLTEEQYNYQLARSYSRWQCPRCGESAYWDDDEYEEGEPNDDEADETDQQTT